MNARPILFSGAMVRALLAGTKTQTRRLFNPERMTWDAAGRYETHALRGGEIVFTGSGPFHPKEWLHYCPYGKLGDLLYVRETWQESDADQDGRTDYYRADYDDATAREGFGPWTPGIHQPRRASRLTLRLTDVRVERLQEISEADARAEGVLYVAGHGEITKAELDADPGYSNYLNCRMGYETLWEQINGCGSWKANPWVWVLQFETIKRNVDAVMADAS